MFIELNHPTGSVDMYNVNTITKIYKQKDGTVHVYFNDGSDNFFKNEYVDIKNLVGIGAK